MIYKLIQLYNYTLAHNQSVSTGESLHVVSVKLLNEVVVLG